jgi:hypothetical protein
MPMDAPIATRRRGFFNNRLDAPGIASHEYDFGSSQGEFDRRGAPDAASCPREHDDGHWD